MYLSVQYITINLVINFLTFDHVLYIILLHIIYVMYDLKFFCFNIFFNAEHSKLER